MTYKDSQQQRDKSWLAMKVLRAQRQGLTGEEIQSLTPQWLTTRKINTGLTEKINNRSVNPPLTPGLTPPREPQKPAKLIPLLQQILSSLANLTADQQLWQNQASQKWEELQQAIQAIQQLLNSRPADPSPHPNQAKPRSSNPGKSHRSITELTPEQRAQQREQWKLRKQKQRAQAQANKK